MMSGSLAGGEGAVGLTMRKSETGFRIADVTPGSPAEKAGLKNNDLLVSIDGEPLADLRMIRVQELLTRKLGGTISVIYIRNEQKAEAGITVEPRSKVYGEEANRPPTVSQFVFDDHAVLSVVLSQSPSQPQSLIVWLRLINFDGPMLSVDDSKFFLLDGQGQQLRHMSVDEVKYSIQLWLSQNWRGGNYPPPTPPPPQHRYLITGTETGNYTFTEMGGMGSIYGNSSGTYTVQEQPDYNQAGYMLGYAIGLAIRQHADKKHNDQILKQAQQTLSQWDANYFRSQSPVIPGENRTGGILYWTGSTRPAVSPFKVVLFLSNPSTGKQEVVNFVFH
jgi:hypothetical protein